ncbi:hypothetical protein PIB30_006156 [Stylosanthes scabra]|uniref:Uncharacterized protein n=1 Tax=Stylosanthes scabra TaxID=79078 RepID=A0ABU6X479_9FABA|nr:hypothetical protein [Stylosanthes scabra]
MRFLGYDNPSDENTLSVQKIMLVQGTVGLIAGAPSSCITTTFDTIKTRLQVMGHENKSSIKQVAKDLMNEDGRKGFYRGFDSCFSWDKLGFKAIHIECYLFNMPYVANTIFI